MSHGTVCLQCRKYVLTRPLFEQGMKGEGEWCNCAEPQPSVDGRTPCRHTHRGGTNDVWFCLICGADVPAGYEPPPLPERKQPKFRAQDYGRGRIVYPTLKLTWDGRWFEVQAGGAVYERRPQAESNAAKQRRLMREQRDGKPLDGRPAMLGPMVRVKDVELAEAVRDRARAEYHRQKALEAEKAALTTEEEKDA